MIGYIKQDGELVSVTTLRIREAALERKEQGVKYRVQAADMGIDTDTLLQYRNGDMLPGTDILRTLATYYGVTADWLLGLED
ncbi:MAG: helix-turn-helix transcriptional regulator [Atopobiaceae bacterium]|nr:helix-turn-helix transcriptional regulator [Atopobiaceae bacterium]